MSTILMNRRYLEAKVNQHFIDPHYATCPNEHLKASMVNTSACGEHVSVVIEPGSKVRTYVFEGQKNRDRFVNLYRQYGARPIGDPLKREEVRGRN